jgi:hypothetical protein
MPDSQCECAHQRVPQQLPQTVDQILTCAGSFR